MYATKATNIAAKMQIEMISKFVSYCTSSSSSSFFVFVVVVAGVVVLVGVAAVVFAAVAYNYLEI